MAVENIFQYAAKHKLRFPYRGSVSVEDLYDLSPEELDKIYKSLKRKEKDNDEESLLKSKKADIALTVQIAIVKEIVEEKLAAVEKAKKKAESRQKRQRILEAIAKKDDDAMNNATKEELQGMLNELDDEDDEE